MDIANEKNITHIANLISNKIGRRLSRVEISSVIEHVKASRSLKWGRATMREILETIAHNFVQARFTDPGRAETKEVKSQIPVDIHEIMKLQIGVGDVGTDEAIDRVDSDGIPVTRRRADVTGSAATPLGFLESVTSVASIGQVQDLTRFLGLSDKYAVQKLFNPTASFRKNYIVLDSRNRLTDSDGTREYAWNFLNNSTETAVGAVNSIGLVKNVVRIRVPSIRIPYSDLVFNNANRRVTMLIRELSSQSFIAPGCRYHFIFEATADGNMIDLVPMLGNTSNSGEFSFAKPVTQIDKLTVSFGVPFEPLVMFTDRQFVNITYTDPDKAIITTADGTPHNLSTTDQIYFTSFTTADPIVDQAIIAVMNSTYGHNVYVESDTEFQIDGINLTTIVNPATGPFLVYYGSKRTIVPLELTYETSGSTSVRE